MERGEMEGIFLEVPRKTSLLHQCSDRVSLIAIIAVKQAATICEPNSLGSPLPLGQVPPDLEFWGQTGDSSMKQNAAFCLVQVRRSLRSDSLK